MGQRTRAEHFVNTRSSLEKPQMGLWWQTLRQRLQEPWENVVEAREEKSPLTNLAALSFGADFYSTLNSTEQNNNVTFALLSALPFSHKVQNYWSGKIKHHFIIFFPPRFQNHAWFHWMSVKLFLGSVPSPVDWPAANLQKTHLVMHHSGTSKQQLRRRRSDNPTQTISAFPEL